MEHFIIYRHTLGHRWAIFSNVAHNPKMFFSGFHIAWSGVASDISAAYDAANVPMAARATYEELFVYGD